MYCIFRERELISSNHISIFRIYPYIEDNYNITINYEVKNPAGAPNGESSPDTSTLVSRTICGIPVLPPHT